MLQKRNLVLIQHLDQEFFLRVFSNYSLRRPTWLKPANRQILMTLGMDFLVIPLCQQAKVLTDPELGPLGGEGRGGRRRGNSNEK